MSEANTPPIGIVIQSGKVDRVHYALLFAAGAAAAGRPVTLFFTMAGSHALEGLTRLLPAEDGRLPEDYDLDLQMQGIAGLDELWESLVALGVRFQACDTGLAAAGVRAPDRVEVTGVVAFLSDLGPSAQIIWV
jgi:uncharacterized protein